MRASTKSHALEPSKISTAYPKPNVSYASHTKPSQPSNKRYQTGQKVRHEKFGVGVVIASAGEGDKESVVVNFKLGGVKQLMLAYAKLDEL